MATTVTMQKRTGLRAALRRWKLRRSGSQLPHQELEEGFMECREALHMLWESLQFTHHHPTHAGDVRGDCPVCEAHEATRKALRNWW